MSRRDSSFEIADQPRYHGLTEPEFAPVTELDRFFRCDLRWRD
jgi:hypothetical protein